MGLKENQQAQASAIENAKSRVRYDETSRLAKDDQKHAALCVRARVCVCSCVCVFVVRD